MPELPVEQRIAFAKAVIDSERLLIQATPNWGDGRKARRMLAERLDARLDDLSLLLMERDGITIPAALDT